MENKLVLLSDGLRQILQDLCDKYKCNIAKDLITADSHIIVFNELNRRKEYFSDPSVANESLNLLDKTIDNLINDEARMLSYRFNTFEISYLPKDKDPVYTDNDRWSRENRVCAKPARIIQKLLVNKYSCKDFENFNNWFKSEVLEFGNFKIVEKDDIAKYYLEDNYFKVAGSLGNSCMRYSKCQKYFDIYKDHAKMLVCLKDDLVLGRAIIWEIGEKTYMDRVYTCMDYLEHQFIAFAEANNWYYRDTQDLLSDGEEQEWLGPEDGYKSAQFYHLDIKLNKEYKYMPYVDTFRYYYCCDENDIYISTCASAETDEPICLSTTDGTVESDYETYICGNCGARRRSSDYPDNWVWSEYLDCDLCEDCAVYCSAIDDYISADTETVNVCVDVDEWDEYPLGYIRDDEDFVEIDDTWYRIPDNDVIVFNEKTNNYELK